MLIRSTNSVTWKFMKVNEFRFKYVGTGGENTRRGEVDGAGPSRTQR